MFFGSLLRCLSCVATVNYYARNDPLVKLDRRAAELMKLTNNTKFQEVMIDPCRMQYYYCISMRRNL